MKQTTICPFRLEWVKACEADLETTKDVFPKERTVGNRSAERNDKPPDWYGYEE